MSASNHTCPLWAGRLLISPLRKLYHRPEKILSEFMTPGATVLEIGPGMGFFSIPMARMVGKTGKVYCADIQAEMLNALMRRAEKASLNSILHPIQCTPESFSINHLQEKIDFCLLFAVVHEVPDQGLLFGEVYRALKPGGKVLLAEPRGHVKPKEWNTSLEVAIANGFSLATSAQVKGSYACVLIK